MRSFGILAILLTPHLATCATLTGQVKYPDGTADHYASVELSSEDASENARSIQRTDKDGWFRFTSLPPGYYRLEIRDKWFKKLRLTSIRIAQDEQLQLRPVQLDLATGSCGSRPFPDHFESMPAADHVGNLGGSVSLIKGDTPLAKAKVTLLCNTGKTCGETKTDSAGAFIFFNVPPGEYALRVTHFGYYPLEVPGYEVREGLRQIYGPLFLERCPNGNCDPRLRPIRSCQ